MLQGKEEIMKNLQAYVVRQKNLMRSNMQKGMTMAENQSKQSAPWKDRTTNARNSIFGVVGPENEPIKGYHGIGVFYGKYLELRWQGKYRVIWPTMDWLKGGGRLLNILAGKL